MYLKYLIKQNRLIDDQLMNIMLQIKMYLNKNNNLKLVILKFK